MPIIRLVCVILWIFDFLFALDHFHFLTEALVDIDNIWDKIYILLVTKVVHIFYSGLSDVTSSINIVLYVTSSYINIECSKFFSNKSWQLHAVLSWTLLGFTR